MVRQLGIPVKLSRTPGEHDRLPAPALGADTRAVLGELGYSEPEVAELLGCGAAAVAEEQAASARAMRLCAHAYAGGRCAASRSPLIGRDRPGIVGAVTADLLRHALNIEDSQMSILRGHFAVVLILAGPAGAG